MITVFGAGATFDQLRAIEPITPKDAGRRWKPIPHFELVETLKDEVMTRGWGITKELFSTTKDGSEMAGALLLDKVHNGHDVIVPGGMSLALGFLNCNTRRKALQITVGAEVTCCLNGLCTGSILLTRVHDHTVDLITEVEIGLNKYVNAAKDIGTIVAGLRERELSQAEASEILMETGRRGLVGWAAVGRVDAEYRHPTFTDNGTGTSWGLLNAFTYAGRQNINPTRQMEVYNKFRTMLPIAA